MHFDVMSVMVDNQAKALDFYTGVLGFVKKRDIPLGEFSWLTVVPAEFPDGVELLLEPNQHPAAQVYQKAMFADGVPLASFAVNDIEAEFSRMTAAGVTFKQKPTKMGPVTVAVFDDTCGNLIQLVQHDQ